MKTLKEMFTPQVITMTGEMTVPVADSYKWQTAFHKAGFQAFMEKENENHYGGIDAILKITAYDKETIKEVIERATREHKVAMEIAVDTRNAYGTPLEDIIKLDQAFEAALNEFKSEAKNA